MEIKKYLHVSSGNVYEIEVYNTFAYCLTRNGLPHDSRISKMRLSESFREIDNVTYDAKIAAISIIDDIKNDNLKKFNP